MARLPSCTRENAMAPGSGGVAPCDGVAAGTRTAASRTIAGRVSRTTIELPDRTNALFPLPPRRDVVSIGRYGPQSSKTSSLHVGDELLHPFVDGPERVLAEHRPLRLIVELEVDPVHRVVATFQLGVPDELAPEPGPGGLRRLAHRPLDLAFLDGAIGGAPPLQHVVQAAISVHVVVREVHQRDPRV